MPHPANVTAPILIVGPARPAPRWLTDALREHPDVQMTPENRVVEAMFYELTQNWWARDWKWVCEPAEVLPRCARAVRSTLCEMFPSEARRWALHLVWRDFPVDFVRAVFPGAKVVHAASAPTGAVPAIIDDFALLDRLDRTVEGAPTRTRLIHAEAMWREGHRLALELAPPEDAPTPMELASADPSLPEPQPYLLVRREDAAHDPGSTWRALTAFLGLSGESDGVSIARMGERARWGDGTSSVGDGPVRPDLPWSSLAQDTIGVARGLGYLADDVATPGVAVSVIAPAPVPRPFGVDEGLSRQARELAEQNAELRERLLDRRAEAHRLDRVADGVDRLLSGLGRLAEGIESLARAQVEESRTRAAEAQARTGEAIARGEESRALAAESRARLELLRELSAGAAGRAPAGEPTPPAPDAPGGVIGGAGEGGGVASAVRASSGGVSPTV